MLLGLFVWVLFAAPKAWRAGGASEPARMKQTVSIISQGKVYTASSVSTVQCVAAFPFVVMSCGRSQYIDPVAIDLGDLGTIYAVDYDGVNMVPDLVAYKQAPASVKSKFGNNRIRNRNYAIEKLMNVEIPVCVQPGTPSDRGLQHRCFTLFRFRNIKDVNSVEVIDLLDLPGDLRGRFELSAMTIGFTTLAETKLDASRTPWIARPSATLSLYGMVEAAKRREDALEPSHGVGRMESGKDTDGSAETSES